MDEEKLMADWEELRTKLMEIEDFSNNKENKPVITYYIRSEDSANVNDWPFCQRYNIYKVNNYYGVIESDPHDKEFKEAFFVGEENQSLENFLNSIEFPKGFSIKSVDLYPREDIVLESSKLHKIFSVE